MDKSVTVLISVVVMAVAVICAAFVVGYNTDSEDEGIDTGVWHQIAYFGYINEEYHDSTVDDAYGAYNYDLNIIGVENGTFAGIYRGASMVGTTEGNTLSFYGDYGGEHIFFAGTVEGDMMYGVTTNSTVGSHRAIFTIYSLDVDKAISSDVFPDVNVLGDWTSSLSYAMQGSDVTYPMGSSLVVEEQVGAVFTGTMEQEIGGVVVDLRVCGVISNRILSGYNLAYVVDYNGENWTALVDNDSVILQSLIVDGGSGDIITVERAYTRDGSDTGSFEVRDLTGTVWTEDHAFTAVHNNIFYETYNMMRISFDHQSGHLITGMITLNLVDCPMAVYMMSDTQLYILMNYNGHYSVMTGELRGDELIFYETFTSTFYDGRVSQVTTMVQDVVCPDDPSGSWYIASAFIIGPDGEIEEYTLLNKDDPSIVLYNLTITDYDEKAFSGYVLGHDIIGEYDKATNRITAHSTDESFFFESTGQFCNDHLMFFITAIDINGISYQILSFMATSPIIVYLPEII